MCLNIMIHLMVYNMNALDTLPQLKRAHLNGVSGTGYAEKWDSKNGEVIRGVVIFDESTDTSALDELIPQDPALFRGMVYSQGTATLQTLAVHIQYVALNELEPGITFRAQTI